ncbi:MAG TPA: PilZ domain-containing protein [Candidatus Solibacter sp.]|nr:PilZ domain-containing protein [Candidatus Solibacter sp.]
MHEEQRGLRFSFNAPAEVIAENSAVGIPARVTELSLRGCRLEMSGSAEERQHLQLKVFHSGETFESAATVIYVIPAGVGLMFGGMRADSRALLQKWILAELDKQST